MDTKKVKLYFKAFSTNPDKHHCAGSGEKDYRVGVEAWRTTGEFTRSI